MSFVLGLAQCAHAKTDTREEILIAAEKWFKFAHEQHVDILVFPESFMGRYSAEENKFLVEPESIEGTFCQGIARLAQTYHMWTVFTFNERSKKEKPYNTAVLMNASGSIEGTYRKVHLFDTDFIKESERVCAGDVLFEPVQTPFGKIGLSICYDTRFPELARFEALHGCQLLITPAAWFDGSLKVMQWQTLLRARAIENEMFVAGLSRPDEGCIGNSVVYGPDGTMLAQAGEEEELLCATIDLAEIDSVRERMPVFAHRKPELYA